jgi:hypothetical protein
MESGVNNELNLQTPKGLNLISICKRWHLQNCFSNHLHHLKAATLGGLLLISLKAISLATTFILATDFSIVFEKLPVSL